MAYFEPFNVKLKPYCRNHALFYVGVFKEGNNLGQKNGGLVYGLSGRPDGSQIIQIRDLLGTPYGPVIKLGYVKGTFT